MTTRFYDGDTGNDVHCWDDGTAGNGDDDPAWRGDFKGLGESSTTSRLSALAQSG